MFVVFFLNFSFWFLFGCLVVVVVTFLALLVCLFFVFCFSVGFCFVLVVSVLVSDYDIRVKQRDAIFSIKGKTRSPPFKRDAGVR